jgi:hypothetical protein
VVGRRVAAAGTAVITLRKARFAKGDYIRDHQVVETMMSLIRRRDIVQEVDRHFFVYFYAP